MRRPLAYRQNAVAGTVNKNKGRQWFLDAIFLLSDDFSC